MKFSNKFLFIFLFSLNVSRVITEQIQTNDKENLVKIVPGLREKKSEKIILPHSPYFLFNFPEPGWRASATIISDSAENPINGLILFHQWSPNNYVRVTINVTGIPAGKHAIHIHAFGDITQGCKSTGPHLQSNFIGNVEAKEDGTISTAFFSAFLNMFGYQGIVGRSIVIHANPIQFNNYPDVFSAQIPIPNDAISYQTEETIVSVPLACGIITITDNLVTSL